jgi:fatty acid desaturase
LHQLDRTNRPHGAVDRETLGLAIAIHTGWLAATFEHRWIPWWLLPVVGGWLIAWHGSLQHETIHGHPTRSRSVNAVIGGAPLNLWLPYETYRDDHIAHHASEDLTEPTADPESRYLRQATGWRAGLAAFLARCNATLLGRLTLGPVLEVSAFLAREAAKLARADRRAWRIWSGHVVQAGLVVAWLKGVCHMSLLLYAATFIYPGAALALLRSFAEHRAAEAPDHRIAIVENAPILGLLFLNNNLHAVHHRHPSAPWTRLPKLYRNDRSRFLHQNGGLVYDGYRDVFRRFLFASHDDVFHPSSRGQGARR